MSWARASLRVLAAFTGGLWTLLIGVALAAVIASWLAGWRLQSIDSPSMAPSVPEGSLAIVVPSNGTNARTGDIVAFRDPADPHRTMLHRIVAVTTSDTGFRYFQTQGDGNATPDPLLVPASNVEGHLGWRVPHLGNIASALRPPFGVVVLAGVPLVVLSATEARRHRRSPRPKRGSPNQVDPAGVTPRAGAIVEREPRQSCGVAEGRPQARVPQERERLWTPEQQRKARHRAAEPLPLSIAVEESHRTRGRREP
jgi:signal peptidase I